MIGGALKSPIVPPALLALSQFGPAEAGLVILGYLMLNALFGYLAEPYLMGRRLRLSPSVVLLSVVLGGWIWGIAGMLLSVPLTMAIVLTLERSDDWSWIADVLRGGRDLPPKPGTLRG